MEELERRTRRINSTRDTTRDSTMLIEEVTVTDIDI